MATYNINVPSKALTPIPEAVSRGIDSDLSRLKSQYGSIISEAAKNSNIPEELLTSFVLFLSNGQNNAPWQSADGLIRSGLFSLSNKVGKGVLATELALGRMSEAEKKYLRESGDTNLNNFLSDTKAPTWGIDEHWKSAFNTGVVRLSDKSSPINWQNPKIAIQTGAIWIGQVWDKIAEQSSKPLDKVIVTIFLPYGLTAQAGSQKFMFSNPFFMGSSFVQNRRWDVDYADTNEATGKFWLPNVSSSGDTTKGFSQKNTSNIINPKGGDVRSVIYKIMAKNGSLDRLVNK